MTDYRCALTGPFPRTETLVQATRDADRGRISPAELERAFVEAERQVAEVEARLRLDPTTGGYLRWADLTRPFTEAWDGVEVGPLTRFFETNTFYRQPTLRTRPIGGTGRLARWLPDPRRGRAILPGPYSFARLAAIEYPAASIGAAAVDLGTALAAELRALPGGPPPQVQFQEPYLAYDPPASAEEVVRAYRPIAEALPRTTTVVWTYFGDAGPALPMLAALPVSGVGFDLFETTVRPTDALAGRAIGVGCLDARTTIPEDERAAAERIRTVVAALRPSTVWLGPSPPLDLLPFSAAVAKVEALPRLAGAVSR